MECADCGAFLKFLARPENIERRKLVGLQLAKLVEHTGLSPWERQFIGSLAKQGTKLSPKQQELLVDMLLGGATQGEIRAHIDALKGKPKGKPGTSDSPSKPKRVYHTKYDATVIVQKSLGLFQREFSPKGFRHELRSADGP